MARPGESRGYHSIDKRRALPKPVSMKVGGISGSITVEASFVMPIVIMTIFLLIYLSFYLHDICRIQGTVDLILHQAGFSLKHEADIATGEVDYQKINDRGVFYLLFGNMQEEEEQIYGLLKQTLAKKLFLVKIDEINVTVNKTKVEAVVKTDTQVNLPVFSYLFELLPDREIKAACPVHNPAETVRYTEVILELGSEIKGVDELKEKIEKFIGS